MAQQLVCTNQACRSNQLKIESKRFMKCEKCGQIVDASTVSDKVAAVAGMAVGGFLGVVTLGMLPDDAADTVVENVGEFFTDMFS